MHLGGNYFLKKRISKLGNSDLECLNVSSLFCCAAAHLNQRRESVFCAKNILVVQYCPSDVMYCLKCVMTKPC